jgi:hypothetical protein
VPDGAPIWMLGDDEEADCLPVQKAILVRNTARTHDLQAKDLWGALDIIESELTMG